MTRTTINNNITFSNGRKRNGAAYVPISSMKLAELGNIVIKTGEPPTTATAFQQKSVDTANYIHLFVSLPIGGYVVLPQELAAKVASVSTRYFKGLYSMLKHENGKDIIWRKNIAIP